MSKKPLPLKYRPNSFETVIGNENEIKILKNNLEKEDGSQCYVITGPAGCGKTTLARIAATYIGADPLTTTELNTADTRGIDTIRDIIEKSRFSMSGNPKVYIIDEAHGLTNDAKRALLKPTEEPPENVYYFLLTTDPIKLFKGDEGKALKTRLTPIKVSSIKSNSLYKHLRKICKKEGLDISNDIIEYISKNSEGSPRTALNLLDSVKDLEDEDTQFERLETAKEESAPELFAFCRALFSSKRNWSELSKMLMAFKESTDPEAIRRMVMGYAQSILLKTPKGKTSNNVNDYAAWVLECFCDYQYSSGFPGITLATYQSLQEPE